MDRLGVIVPSTNTAVEHEFPRQLPDNIDLHTARVRLSSVTVDGLDAMAGRATNAGSRIGDVPVDAVGYACTTGSLLHGPDFARDLEASLHSTVGAPAAVTALSVDRALSALGIERPAVITPYSQSLVTRERDYLEALGYSVSTIDGRGIQDNHQIGQLTPAEAATQAKTCLRAAPDSDGVFISCTNYRTMPVIEQLESRFELPVVSSNTATLWNLLSLAGASTDCIPGQLATCRSPE